MDFKLNPLIVGLPRSRTAWLSVFMSQSKTYFYHEAVNGCYSIDEYNKKVKGCGDSTTGFSVLLDNLKDRKVLIIKKDDSEIKECIKWCDENYIIDGAEVLSKMSDILSGIDGLVINQSEIDDNLEVIWEYLVDDDWHDKYKNLSKMNIQVNSTEIDLKAAVSLYESIQ